MGTMFAIGHWIIHLQMSWQTWDPQGSTLSCNTSLNAGKYAQAICNICNTFQQMNVPDSCSTWVLGRLHHNQTLPNGLKEAKLQQFHSSTRGQFHTPSTSLCTTHTIHISAYFCLIHPPQLYLPVICSWHNQRKGWMEAGPVHTPVMALQDMFNNSICLPKQVCWSRVLKVVIQTSRSWCHILLTKAYNIATAHWRDCFQFWIDIKLIYIFIKKQSILNYTFLNQK